MIRALAPMERMGTSRLNPFRLFYELLGGLFIGASIALYVCNLWVPFPVGSRGWLVSAVLLVLLASGPLMLWRCIRAGMRMSHRRGHIPIRSLKVAGLQTALTLFVSLCGSVMGAMWLRGANAGLGSESAAWIFGICGAVVSSVLGLTVWLLCFGRERAVALAHEMTLDLQRLATVVQHTSNGVILTDDRCQIIWVNRAFVELSGYSEQEVFGRPLDEILQFERTDQADLERLRLALDAQQSFTGELLNCSKGGREYWMTLEIKPMSDEAGQLNGFMAIGTDVTERREMQETVISSQTLLRGAIDALDEAFALFDPQDRLVFCNEKYRDIYQPMCDLIVPGAPFESIIRGGVELGLFLEAQGQTEEWITARIAAHRSGSNSLIHSLSDGRVLKVAERKLPDGHSVGFRIDITDLARAIESAQNATEVKGRFLANMSHEIRTPMNAIIGMTALALEGELNSDQRDLMSTVRDSATALLALINDILDYSKIEAGQMELEAVEFDLSECVAAAAGTLAKQARDKRLTLDWSIAANLSQHVIGDPHRLRQVLLNLISNGLKFTQRGGLNISVSCKGGAGMSSNLLELHFRVRDTGIGIPADQVEQIFAPFMQADDSTTRRFGGTGLGLSISRSIVERMNGRIWVESRVGVGSTFHFTAVLASPDRAGQAASLRATGQRVGSAPKPIVAPPMPLAGPRPHVVIWQATTDNDPFLADSLHQWQMKTEVVSELSQVAAALARQPANAGPRTVVVKASALHGISERSMEMALAGTAHRFSAILLEDTALPDRLAAMFTHSLTWPGSSSALFDALACIDGFANSALYDYSTNEVMDADEVPSARRILLAEDHPINQKLARRLLEQMGHEVVVADDGATAVQLCDQQSFDIIFMDVQMPVMNGFDATHEIRNRDRARGHFTPIVAMTAHAMAGDRERCLAVGMDGYVSKPITRVALEQVIKAHALRSAQTQPPTASVKPGESAVDRINLSFDGASGLAIFDRQSALARLGGDVSLLDELIEIFLTRGESDARHLHEAMTAHDLIQLCHVAHALRGAASSLGADELSSCATEVEQACRQDHAARAMKGGKALLIALQKVLLVMRPNHDPA